MPMDRTRTNFGDQPGGSQNDDEWPETGCDAVPAYAPILLGGCVVWKSDYDQVVSQNQQLQQRNAANDQQIAADKAQIGRLQGAIKYTVNSDQLFTPGSWAMSAQGKQIIAKMASQLAPTQQNKIVITGYTDNAPIGPELQRQASPRIRCCRRNVPTPSCSI
jgi:outer membrane protein OmpA-like peptidoglycan-associated protein